MPPQTWLTLDTSATPQRSGFPQQRVRNVLTTLTTLMVVYQLLEYMGSHYNPANPCR